MSPEPPATEPLLTVADLRTFCSPIWEILRSAKPHNVPLPLFGSAAVLLRCAMNEAMFTRLGRAPFRDLDFVTHPQHFRAVERVLLSIAGVTRHPEYERYRLRGRLEFCKDEGRGLIEVFPNPLEFHHTIDVGKDLDAFAETVSPTALLLSRLQVDYSSLSDAAKTKKNLTDSLVLLVTFECGDAERGFDQQTLTVVGRSDFAFGFTMKDSLLRVEQFANEMYCEGRICERELASALAQVQKVRGCLAGEPKSIGWKCHSRVHQLVRQLGVGTPVEDPPGVIPQVDSYVVRLLAASDADQWWNLRHAALRSCPDAFTTSLGEHLTTTVEDAGRLLSVVAPERIVLGLFDNEVLIGSARFDRCERAKERHRGVVGNVFVSSVFRGLGLAKRLLQRLLELVQEFPDIEQVCLTVNPRQGAARKLYARFGFIAMGMHQRALKGDEGYYDLEEMVLYVGESLKGPHK